MTTKTKLLHYKGMPVWPVALLLLAALTACGNKGPDLAATITAMEATLEAQQVELATLESAAVQPAATSMPAPSPTEMPTRKPTIILETPPPASTLQRPPTATPSRTPTPRPTATPTATPIPDAAVGDQLTNLRSGPAVGYPILAEVAAGTPLDVLGKSADGEWIKVRIPDGTEGWMFLLPVNLFIPLDSVAVVD